MKTKIYFIHLLGTIYSTDISVLPKKNYLLQTVDIIVGKRKSTSLQVKVLQSCGP